MRHGIISSCQSAATSEIVNRCYSSLVSSAITSTRTFIEKFDDALRGVVLVVGCADVAVPDSAWAERQSDLLTLRCNASQETWYLTCKGRRWVGTMANCSSGKKQYQQSPPPAF